MTSKLRLIMLGAPGSGKGTISKRIAKEFGLPHYASGDVLRSNIDRKTHVGQTVKDLVARGQLVSDDLITKIMVDIVKPAQAGWLLDGFPRTLAQAKSMDEAGVVPDRVINLNVPFDEIINRLKHRWIHPASGRIYNLEFNPPQVEGKDDLTGEKLVQREDDKPETVLKRLKLYENSTRPIIEFYQAKNILETFTGNTSDYLTPLIKKDIADYVIARNEMTHTGQIFESDDYRRTRFDVVNKKIVNKNWAIDLVQQDPIVVVNERKIWSDGGGPLGHPRIYINLDRDEVHDCGYSGRRFIQKKYYKAEKHGPCITYDEYLKQEESKRATGF